MAATAQTQNVAQGSPPQRIYQLPANYLGLIPRGMLRKLKDFFVNVPVISTGTELPASGARSYSFQVDGDADFCTLYLVGEVYTSAYAAVVNNPAILVDVRDTGSGRSPFSAPVLWDNLFGTAQRPSLLGFPKIYRANSTVNVQLQNQVATAYVVNMAFVGFKVFPTMAEMAE